MRKILASLFALCIAPAPAAADGALPKLVTPFDKARLAAFDQTVKAALAEARAQGARADVAVLDQVLAGSPLPLASGFDATGNWSCRTIKAGGTPALVVYAAFKCRISDDGAGWMLEKISGSQRTKGMLYTLSDTSLAYLGAGYVSGEAPRTYNQDPKENQVALVERRGKNRLVFLFPAPQYESKLDILVLER